MFGLMRVKKCWIPETDKRFRRWNYCQTCKPLGALYGQRSSLLINHDAIFPAEILSPAAGE